MKVLIVRHGQTVEFRSAGNFTRNKQNLKFCNFDYFMAPQML